MTPREQFERALDALLDEYVSVLPWEGSQRRVLRERQQEARSRVLDLYDADRPKEKKR